jgi:hypothetical protein
MIQLSNLFSNGSPARVYGKCTINCIPYSEVCSIHTLASHCVFFRFKHWLIYIDVVCQQHKHIERWCIEKMWKELADIEPGIQVIQINNIYISCTQYRIIPVKWRCLKSPIYCGLSNLIYFICTMTDNNYNLIFNNCFDFNTEFELLSQNYFNSYFEKCF